MKYYLSTLPNIERWHAISYVKRAKTPEMQAEALVTLGNEMYPEFKFFVNCNFSDKMTTRIKTNTDRIMQKIDEDIEKAKKFNITDWGLLRDLLGCQIAVDTP